MAAYKTDPLVAYSDGYSVLDGEDVTNGYNPNDPVVYPPVLSSLEIPPPLLPETLFVTVSTPDTFFIPGLALLEVLFAFISQVFGMRRKNKH